MSIFLPLTHSDQYNTLHIHLCISKYQNFTLDKKWVLKGGDKVIFLGMGGACAAGIKPVFSVL